ncbi:MAG: TRAP transporter TatT component family protein [Myxococcales bacterium]|nr:TRAP transporter TatT component family protein [Myxococcales bacterium]
MIRSFWLVAGLALVGCGKHPGSYTTSGEAAQGDASAAITKADALWAQRVDEGKLQEAIAAYEAVLTEDATNRHAMHRLTRALYFWGTAFTDEKEQKIERLGRAIESGTRCIGLNEQIRTAIEAGDKEKEAVVHATKDDVPCLYWTASALGQWGRANGISRTLKHLPTVRAYMTKIDELDPSFFSHGPARYWGAYYAALPSFAGQDLEKSGVEFASSVEASPHYLGTRFLRAEIWAVATGDLAQFDEDIVTIVGADPDAKPEADVTPENVKTIEAARTLFEKRSELFSRKSIEEAGDPPTLPAAYTPPPEPEAPTEDDPGMSEGQEPDGESDQTAQGSDSTESNEN